MSPAITLTQVQQRIEENHLRHEILDLQDGACVIVLERGGRILGPFLNAQGESMLWLNAIWASTADFAAFLGAESLGHDQWNLGGDRIWIAPEIQYSVRDRNDFWGTVQCPPAVDPGHYRLQRPRSDTVALSQDVRLQAHNLASGAKELHIDRRVRAAANPLRALAEVDALMADVQFAGLEHSLTLAEARTDEIMSEGWNIAQLHPGGEILIPASPLVTYNDYFAPVDAEHLRIDRDTGLVRIKICGRKQFKVGFKAAHVFGRLAYVNRLHDGRSCLLIRNFFNNPSALYAEEPPHLPGCHGHSVHIYNDDGNRKQSMPSIGASVGGFGELEVMAQTIGGETGRSASTDAFLFWLFAGPPERLHLIARHLLGVSLVN